MNRTLRLLVLALSVGGFQSATAQKQSYIESLNTPNKWVDSVFRKMSKKEKIAQMFFVRAHTNLSKQYQDSVGRVIKKEKLGGVVFFQGGPGRQLDLTSKYQSYAKVPLLISSDGEWGLGMRLDSTVSFPYQMTLGAIQDDKLLYKMGLEVARQFKRVGMQFNLAPVADVNNNAKNPVINFRSFGEDKINVTKKVGAYMQGMQDGGIMVSLKHFPGHGDTDVDSHYDLPLLGFSKERLDSLELYPFKELIKQGAAGVMIAHMNIPSLDNTPNLPSTLSRPIVTGLLKEKLGFKGLIITDAMNMKGVAKFYKDGEAELRAAAAGNDIMELANDSKIAVKKIRKAMRKGQISKDQIYASVKKILLAKYWTGLTDRTVPSSANVVSDLNNEIAQSLIDEMASASITVLKGKEYISGLSKSAPTVILSIGSTTETPFQAGLKSHFTNASHLNLNLNATANDIANLMGQLKPENQVIISIHDTRSRPGNNLPMSKDVVQFINEQVQKNAVITLFANPYNLAAFNEIEKSKGLIVAYQKEEFMQRAVVKYLTGKSTANGKLPVTVTPTLKFGAGE